MSQLWALVTEDGAFVLRVTPNYARKPRRSGCAGEIRRGVRVHRLAREPDAALGERVAWERGGIVFDQAHAPPGRAPACEQQIGAIRAEAGRRIEAIAPIWRQLNDLRESSEAGAARFAAIDAVRAWSDALEARAVAAGSADECRAIAAELAGETRP